MHTGHCDIVILRFSTSKTKLYISPPSGSFPMLFHPCSCLTLDFEDLSLLTFSASCALPPSRLVIGTCWCFLQQVVQTCPFTFYFTRLSPQVQLISQVEVSSPSKAKSSSVIHPVPAHHGPPRRRFVC